MMVMRMMMDHFIKSATPERSKLMLRLCARLSLRANLLSRGQSMVELALMVPALALVLVATADFGRVYFTSVAVENAARAGVQYGAQSLTTSVDITGMEQAACNDFGISDLTTCQATMTTTATSFCECVGSTAVVSCSSTCDDGGVQEKWVQVNTSTTFNTLLTYPGIPSSYPISQVAMMRAK